LEILIFFNLNKIEESLKEKKLYEKYQLDPKKHIILLTTTGLQELHYGTIKHNYDTQTWRNLLENFASDNNYQIILKPHPAENPITYEKILKEYDCSNAKIIQGNLLELIFVSSILVSIFSSTMIDALCLKKPVVKVIFGDAYSTPLDDSDVAVNSELSDLSKNIRLILNDEAIKNNLKKNSVQFIKYACNIPEEKPETILEKVLE